MIPAFYLIGIGVLPLIFLLLPRAAHPYANVGFGVLLAFPTSYLALRVLIQGTGVVYPLPFAFWGAPLELVMDPLSAFFVLVINLATVAGGIYAIGYMEAYLSRPAAERALHFTAYAYLHYAMVLLTLFQHGIAFLFVWELMSVASFVLVIFEGEKPETLKAGIRYLVQMHIGAMFLFTGFFLLARSGAAMDFRGLAGYFAGHANWPLALVFLVGFGVKAGLVPFHTWLPHAHPAAPSHVSGLMSGVMIKMGIYGIVRVLLHVQHDYLLLGGILFGAALVSGLLGVMLAIVQHDLKRLLAYHSIENIGIIGMGLGLGLVGLGVHQPALAFLGFAGGLLHVLNHSLFKSVLFFGAGSVYLRTHTRHLDHLGGLARQMPHTAFLFVMASLAICGLPPLNGFVSEFLLYNGFLKGLGHSTINMAVGGLAGVFGLALIGGLAIFCFTKAFGIVFLGTARSAHPVHATEVGWKMLGPQYFLLAVMGAVGLMPGLFVRAITPAVAQLTPDMTPLSVAGTLDMVGGAGGLFLLLIGGLYALRRFLLRRRPVAAGPTWGCGYAAGSSRMQYTATSYAQPYAQLAGPVLDLHTDYRPIPPSELFPEPRRFETGSEDPIEDTLFLRPTRRLSVLLQKASVIQTGQTRHYVLYAFFFILLLLVLTFFKVI